MEARDRHYFEVQVTLKAESPGRLYDFRPRCYRFAVEIVETTNDLLMLGWEGGPTGGGPSVDSKLVFPLTNVLAYSVDLIEGEPPNWGSLSTYGDGVQYYV